MNLVFLSCLDLVTCMPACAQVSQATATKLLCKFMAHTMVQVGTLLVARCQVQICKQRTTKEAATDACLFVAHLRINAQHAKI